MAVCDTNETEFLEKQANRVSKSTGQKLTVETVEYSEGCFKWFLRLNGHTKCATNNFDYISNMIDFFENGYSRALQDALKTTLNETGGSQKSHYIRQAIEDLINRR